MAGAFDENEFAAQRRVLKDEAAKLNADLLNLQPQRATREQFEAQKATLLTFSANLGSVEDYTDASFDVKQKIIK